MKTKAEQEILNLLQQNITIKEIANRRQTSVRAVQKIVKKLKEKQVLGSSYKGFVSNPSTTPPSPHKLIRLHGQEFNIKIKYKSQNYKQISELKGNKIRFLNDNKIEIYSKQHFFGKSGWEAHYNSELYFKRFFILLQNKLGCLFSQIKEVNHHYSEMDNEIAEDNHNKKRKLNIKSTSDNKIWAKTDFSFKINEFEFLHPNTALEDTDNIIPFFNDLRDNKVPLPSIQYDLLSKCIQIQQMFNENLVKHMKVLDDMSATMKDIRESIKPNKPILDILKERCHSIQDVINNKDLIALLTLEQKKDLSQWTFENMTPHQ